MDLRKELEAIVNEISKANGRDEHEQTDAGPCKYHRRVNEDDAKKTGHGTGITATSEDIREGLKES